MSSWTFNYEHESEDELEVGEAKTSGESKFWNTKDCILFAIDCNESMVSSESLFVALESARSVLEHKIISSERDLVGILLYNTRESQNASSFQNIFLLQDIQEPDANIILTLDKVIKGT